MSRKLVSVQISSALFLDLANYLQEFGDERDPAEVAEAALASWLCVARGEVPEAEVRGCQWKRLFLPEGTENARLIRNETLRGPYSGPQPEFRAHDSTASPAVMALIEKASTRRHGNC